MKMLRKYLLNDENIPEDKLILFPSWQSTIFQHLDFTLLVSIQYIKKIVRKTLISEFFLALSRKSVLTIALLAFLRILNPGSSFQSRQQTEVHLAPSRAPTFLFADAITPARVFPALLCMYNFVEMHFLLIQCQHFA